LIPKYLSHAVFISSAIYSLYFPSFQVALLTLTTLAYHAHEAFYSFKTSSQNIEKQVAMDKFDILIAELKDDVTKMKMAQVYKR